MTTPYAELHCHSNFSFLDGASPVEDLVAQATEVGLSGLAITDHGGLYGVVRFATEAEAAGIRPILGVEIELLDPAMPDPAGVVIPARRRRRSGRAGARIAGQGWGAGSPDLEMPVEGLPARPRPSRTRLPGHRAVVKEDLRGIGERQSGPHLVLLARDASGYRSLCRLISHANLAGTKRVPRFDQALLARHTEGLIALSGCGEGEIARRLRVGDREGAAGVARTYASLFGSGDGVAAAGFYLELSHHLQPDDDWLVAETARLAAELGLPVVVTNDAHYARPEDRELQDVLTGIFHGRTLETLGDLRRPDGESYLKSGSDLAALVAPADGTVATAWAAGMSTAVELAASCSVDLGFEQYRFPGFPVPDGETP
ncbi:MAG TPA: PHP domain-containing protein, partial [Candidatus Limnocylindrales bacterium]|nr:PHP domain-containing protein [Candidatus Limnocylindrales bacterium]